MTFAVTTLPYHGNACEHELRPRRRKEGSQCHLRVANYRDPIRHNTLLYQHTHTIGTLQN